MISHWHPFRLHPITVATRFVPLALAAALTLAAVAPAQAAKTDWVESEGGKVRLVATPPAIDGSIRAAVVIELKPGWTTYWRNPGESGVPPQISVKGSTNVRSAALSFPPPTRLDEGGVPAIGYERSVAFPLSIRQAEPGKPSVLIAELFLGMCRNICVPVSASYRLTIAPEPKPADTAAATQVALAYAELPAAESAAFGIESVEPSSDGKSLRVKARLPQPATDDDPPELFVAGPAGWSFGVPELEAAEASAATFAVPVIAAPEGASLSGTPVDVVVADGPNSMEAKARVR